LQKKRNKEEVAAALEKLKGKTKEDTTINIAKALK
jgi:hypothetical protein